MGLDIAYETLKQYLAERFESPRAAERAVRAIAQEVERQTGRQTRLSENSASEQLTSERYGPYSSLHVLRLYASRVAGYTLDEAYSLPLKRIRLRKTDAGVHPGDSGNGFPDGVDRGDEEFAQEWGVPVDVLAPRAPVKIEPFPYPHLVCFSDAEGIYVPVDFPQPFLLDDIYVGSSVHLHAELQDVGRHLVEAILETMKNPHEEREQFLLYVRQLWWALESPCAKSVKAKTSMVFT